MVNGLEHFSSSFEYKLVPLTNARWRFLLKQHFVANQLNV